MLRAIARLEDLDLPRSMCALVDNLLDCSNGDFCGDDAYRSLADVRTDLELMRDDPTSFLHDLRPSAGLTFEIRPRFYGREDDISNIEHAYLEHRTGNCGGMLVSGGAGVGKSSLVVDVTRRLAADGDRYFLEATFDQNENVNPLNEIGAMFNALCDLFAKDATRSQLVSVAETLEIALGSLAGLLKGVVPSLAKLTSCVVDGTSVECIDVAASMKFLFEKLLEVLSDHKSIVLFLDDLQWADPASLMLIMDMISNTKGKGNVFFPCCFRDDDIKEGDPFAAWLSNINAFPFRTLHLENISKEGVNELVSETLH
ncbi:hypothetical protein ACHAWF_001416, partial [Thalassiosira exigua]